jgi:hypothetical protein
MSQTTELRSSIKEYIQQRIKNAVVSCEIVTNDFAKEETLFAATISIIATDQDKTMHRASEQTVWHKSERFTFDEISDELDFIARSLVCRLGFAMFYIYTKET